MNTEHVDKEFIILENIYNSQEKIRQRDLADGAGISLGMTNAIMKRLIKKGFLIAKKISKKNIHYAVTPTGIKAIMKRSYRYFKRTMDNIGQYKMKIDGLIRSINEKGFSRVCLIGKSDLDFIIEYFCNLSRLKLVRQEKSEKTTADKQAEVFYIYSENATAPKIDPSSPAVALFEWLK